MTDSKGGRGLDPDRFLLILILSHHYSAYSVGLVEQNDGTLLVGKFSPSWEEEKVDQHYLSLAMLQSLYTNSILILMSVMVPLQLKLIEGIMYSVYNHRVGG